MVNGLYFRKILVPVDGSRGCLQAQEVAVSFAKNFKSNVTVVHVVSHDLLHAKERAYREVPIPIVTEITNWFSEAGRKILADAEALFKEEGIEVDSRFVEYEDPAETIIHVAKDEGYSLVVMGNHGENEADTSSLGSVAEKVARYAECPTLIVKEPTSMLKILVGVDGSEHAAKAVECTVQLAERNEAEVTLLHVGESKLFSLKPNLMMEIGERILSEAAGRVEGVKARTQLESGNPAKTIVNVAEKGEYDLIVVGSRGVSGVKRFFLGSVSDYVTRNARCSVLIAR